MNGTQLWALRKTLDDTNECIKRDEELLAYFQQSPKFSAGRLEMCQARLRELRLVKKALEEKLEILG